MYGNLSINCHLDLAKLIMRLYMQKCFKLVNDYTVDSQPRPISKITQSQTKFHHDLSNISMSILNQVSEAVITGQNYDQMKETVPNCSF